MHFHFAVVCMCMHNGGCLQDGSISIPLLMYAVISLTLSLVGPPYLDSFPLVALGTAFFVLGHGSLGGSSGGFLFECSTTHIVIVLNQPQMSNKSFLDRWSGSSTKWLLGFQEPEANISQSQDTCAKEKVLTRSPALAGLFKDISIHWPESQF